MKVSDPKIDPLKIDLEKTTLIEASAGTGKTYTITTLYCRMVAKGYLVDSILVVTFTEAAAAELKIRIRQRLFNAMTQLGSDSSESDDDLVAGLRSHEDLPRVILRLKAAITSFDQASVMTIHSFCLKVLKENAFESRSLFDIQLAPDRSAFFKQVVYDYFMAKINTLDPLFLNFLALKNFTPDTLSSAFSNLVARQDLVVRPNATEFESRFDEYRHIVQKVHGVLLNQKDVICDVIDANKGIKKQSYAKRFVPGWIDKTIKKIEKQGRNTVFKMIEKGDPIYRFTQTCLESKANNKGLPLPDHELFDLCETLLSIYHGFEKNLMGLKVLFLAFFRDELEKFKASQGICFFDDLVNDLAQVIEGPDNKSNSGRIQLVTQIRNTYNACLIDEFQDTDPRQYHIFSSIFALENRPFFMVGDPKQAIYAFRGGDIFAYLKAAQICDQKTTLEKNYRSAPLLVNGVNAIFTHHENPFLFDDITFTPVGTPETAKNRLVQDIKEIAPLQFCFVERQKLDQKQNQIPNQIPNQRPSLKLDKQGMISKETAKRMIPDIVAEDILNLIGSNHGLLNKEGHSEQISPGDMAVLVRTNAQADQIQNALSQFGIPSFQSSTGSVYDSQQAIELHDILWAILHADQKRYVKAALATSVFGCQANDMMRLDENEEDFFHYQQQFSEYKTIWESRGFVSMIMALFHSREAFLKVGENASSDKLVLDERAMTNFYHLIELIGQTLVHQHLSPLYLFKWYTDQLSKDHRDESADQLRLESDKQAVAIVTIHKSKGLEYPVVYLPYLWDGAGSQRKDHALFHDPAANHDLTLDLGSEDQIVARAQADLEEQAEQRRLLYVALTRASALCRIIWGGIKSVDTSALGSLLHTTGCKDDQTMIVDLENIKVQVPESIEIHRLRAGINKNKYLMQDSESQDLIASSFSRKVDAAWTMSSFSAITHSVFSQHGAQARSENKKEDESIGAGEEIVLKNFPKGAGAGDFFHSIYEDIDFTLPFDRIESMVQTKAELMGFSDPDWIRSAALSVQDVLKTKLVGGEKTFCLGQINDDQRFNELEFAFNVKDFNISKMQTAFESSDPTFLHSGYVDRLLQINTNTFKGFIKGFIDLIVQCEGRWYILDYKTNYLGGTYAHYGKDALFDAMMEHHYFLQYHLYMIALHRYLGLRMKNYDYDQHFGGVFYLFVRGMQPELESNTGVFFQRPDQAAIQYLSDQI